jgi:hypothetical protein
MCCLLLQNGSIGPEPASLDDIIEKSPGEKFLIPRQLALVGAGGTKPSRKEKIFVTCLTMQQSTDD